MKNVRTHLPAKGLVDTCGGIMLENIFFYFPICLIQNDHFSTK